VIAEIISRISLTEGKEDMHILKAIFLAGGGGSGKGVVADAMFAGTGMKVINADKHLERFMKDLKIPFAEVGSQYTLFRKARDLMQQEMRHYALARLGIIVDSTAWDYDRVAKPVQKLRKLGYDVYMVFVDTSLETALQRNIARGKKGGRDVPDSFIETAWRGAQKNKARYAKLFGKKNLFVLDNDKDIEKKTWANVIAPKLRSLSNRILKRPVSNKVGQRWLKDTSKVSAGTRAAEWPKPPKPAPLAFTYDEPETPEGKVGKKGKRNVGKKGPATLKAKFSGKGKADLGAMFPELFGKNYIRSESITEAFICEKDLSQLKPDDNSLASNLEAMYELEWKYYQIKNSPFTGHPKRYANLLKLYVRALKVMVQAIAKQLLPTFETWLEKHALTSAKTWAEQRASELEGEGIKFEMEQAQSEYDRYSMGFNSAIYSVNLDKMPRLRDLVELLYHEDKDMWDEEEEGDEYPYETVADYWEAQDGMFTNFADFLETVNIPEDSKRDIIKEVYQVIVFPVWFGHWKALGIVQTRREIEKHAKRLRALSGSIKKVNNAVVRLNLAVNAAHQTGSMTDYIQDTYSDVDKAFLEKLSNQTIPAKWKKELGEIGVAVGAQSDKKAKNWQALMRAYKTFAEAEDGPDIELALDELAERVFDTEAIYEKYDGREGPEWKTLKKNTVKLSDAERKQVMDADATWHHGPKGEATPAVWKAVVRGVAWFVTNTHRAFNVRPTLKGAISRYHKFIKGTA